MSRLLIRNLITVEKAVFEPGTGFNVLTGETGAGKSVILKAIALLMGNKASRDLIRADEDSMMVEGVFDISSHQSVQEMLESSGFMHDGLLVLKRQVQKNGSNRVFVNDQQSNNQMLSQLAGEMIDMHSQHAQQDLASRSAHVHFLDQYAGLHQKLLEYKQLYSDWTGNKKTLAEGVQDIEERNRKIDFIEFQIQEIENAGFSVEEEDSLMQEQKQLQNKERLVQLLGPVLEWEFEDHSPLMSLNQALSGIREAAGIDERILPAAEMMEAALINLDEVSREIGSYQESLEFSDEQVEKVNQRLSELDHLKRKYGSSVSAVLQFQEQLNIDLEKLKSLESNLKELEDRVSLQENELWLQAEAISAGRKGKAGELSRKIRENLAYLGLGKADFQIEMIRQNELGAFGVDKTGFLFTANPGQPLQPLSKIASGGELSRVMLSLKAAAREQHQIMIFDEIDSGVSGVTASHVGEKLRELAKDSQVICITHSPQVASQAESHWKVLKENRGKNTYSGLQLLNRKERIQEIAQFISGNVVSKQAVQTAEEMLIKANE